MPSGRSCTRIRRRPEGFWRRSAHGWASGSARRPSTTSASTVAGTPGAWPGEEITLAGRIVAVADAYDCIVSSRSYKAAAPAEQARAELAAGSGAQFDPEIVRALLAVAIHRLHPSRS